MFSSSWARILHSRLVNVILFLRVLTRGHQKIHETEKKTQRKFGIKIQQLNNFLLIKMKFSSHFFF